VTTVSALLVYTYVFLFWSFFWFFTINCTTVLIINTRSIKRTLALIDDATICLSIITWKWLEYFFVLQFSLYPSSCKHDRQVSDLRDQRIHFMFVINQANYINFIYIWPGSINTSINFYIVISRVILNCIWVVLVKNMSVLINFLSQNPNLVSVLSKIFPNFDSHVWQDWRISRPLVISFHFL
jgi:hypothetical protein